MTSYGSGQLGELVVRRSGKMQLVMGGHVFDVQRGTMTSFDQEVVSMRMPAKPGEPCEMHRLGKMQERMVCTPDLEHLLKRCSTAEPPKPK